MWGAVSKDDLGKGAYPWGTAGEKHPHAASVWEIVVSCTGGGRCTHGLVSISLAFGTRGSSVLPQISYLTSGTSYVNGSVKTHIYQKFYESKYIKVREVFWYSGDNSHLSGSGRQSEMKIQEAELELCIEEQVAAL